MASLYIKDEETNRLAERLASVRGLTKTAAVKLALTHELERKAPCSRRPAVTVLEEFWRTHKLGEPTGLEADKAFYDSLNDEDDD
ncbi:type II toxin-antitoxin system VapB family antitoxin [Sphingomonas sp. LR60]|uniref:type II toxin-antitoxin system VapB family antitoxin n=1 Tax=Sphingomonas sp. LR60 TaxID=3050233 RepID=UPI002FE3544B